MDAHILIIEDEAAIREMVCNALERAGFRVSEAGDAREAREWIVNKRPDLVLLDWMLPGISGIEFARSLRDEELTQDIPVIMLTARGEEADRIKGFAAGVDDYVSKPFSLRELIARVKAVLRRSSPLSGEDPLEVQELRLEPASHRVTVSGQAVKMGPTEFRLLRFFMNHPERVFTRGQLLDRVWGSNVYVEERTVDVHIRRLRKSLSLNGHDRLIQTVRGTGYRFSRQRELA